MSAPHVGRAAGALAAAALLAAAPAAAAAGPSVGSLLKSVVKIHVTVQRPDYAQPWQAGAPGTGSGTGFVISRRRILTNAHVVSDAKFLEVQRSGEARKVPAHVVFAGHDCDLAVLEVDAEGFLDGMPALEFGTSLPELGQEVYAIGYPMGGTVLSLTRGVVSRVDMHLYTHSGVDSHLVIQTDAAINPGNSGGPVVFDGRVVGVAFQALSVGQNIGYAIPLPVVQHFLADIADGRYDGYPELGVVTLDSRNPALRDSLGLTDPSRGALIVRVDPFGAGARRLFAGDVLLAADGHPIAPDGSVLLAGANLDFNELVERRQWGEKMLFEVWRTGRVARVEVPLDNPPNPFAYRHEYDTLPEYVLAGGLLFAPISRGLLGTLDGKDDRAVQPVFYYAGRATVDDLVQGRDEFVVLGGRLPHAANTYADPFLYKIVAEVNGRRVRGLADVAAGFAHPTNGFDVIRFEGYPLPLVLDAAGRTNADAEVQARYGVPVLQRLRPEAAP
jgi:S1-C subfamily serine protease